VRERVRERVREKVREMGENEVREGRK